MSASTPEQKPNEEQTPTEVRIIDVLTEREVVLDKGLADGMVVGARYKVVRKTDVGRDENLGTIEKVIQVLEVVEVYEKFSVAKPPVRVRSTLRLPTFAEVSERVEEPLLQTDVTPRLPAKDLKLQIGDIAQLVTTS